MFSAYEILQVDEGASDEEIQRAFRRKALLYHPDRLSTSDHLDFVSLKKAQELLLNSSLRHLFGHKKIFQISQRTRMTKGTRIFLDNLERIR
ncbi:MAG: hypothetical protein COV44_01740 [Deltaproteobacteria bacterium CG11_big_fil_rev_8_21_14_0_20_45_16]|nr:MAG: hypothetical protein COV44_01740 [Deltaproteobacteria bacterium CG11_big_fil_rev_8_21_14_0_20_45_16]